MDVSKSKKRKYFISNYVFLALGYLLFLLAFKLPEDFLYEYIQPLGIAGLLTLYICPAITVIGIILTLIVPIFLKVKTSFNYKVIMSFAYIILFFAFFIAWFLAEFINGLD